MNSKAILFAQLEGPSHDLTAHRAIEGTIFQPVFVGNYRG
jgi:hypothetical protein